MPRHKQKRPLPRESLARNLKWLVERHEMSYRDVAKKTGNFVSAKTVGNIINQVGASSVDNVDAIAHVFGLDGWQLMLPNLIADLEGDTSIAKVYESYSRSSTEGRRHILRVAEREAEYNREAS